MVPGLNIVKSSLSSRIQEKVAVLETYLVVLLSFVGSSLFLFILQVSLSATFFYGGMLWNGTCRKPAEVVTHTITFMFSFLFFRGVIL